MHIFFYIQKHFLNELNTNKFISISWDYLLKFWYFTFFPPFMISFNNFAWFLLFYFCLFLNILIIFPFTLMRIFVLLDFILSHHDSVEYQKISNKWIAGFRERDCMLFNSDTYSNYNDFFLRGMGLKWEAKFSSWRALFVFDSPPM